MLCPWRGEASSRFVRAGLKLVDLTGLTTSLGPCTRACAEDGSDPGSVAVRSVGPEDAERRNAEIPASRDEDGVVNSEEKTAEEDSSPSVPQE